MPPRSDEGSIIMPKKILMTVLVIVLFAAVSFIAVSAAVPDGVKLPQAITPESPCPVAGCTYKECHAAADAPQPVGTFLMTCPDVVSCSSVDCHAWEALTGHYNAPKDWSMNVWILAPVLLVVALVLVVRKF